MMGILLAAGRLLPVVGCCFAMLAINLGNSALIAQETKSKEQAELVDGLLDLLKEPATKIPKPSDSVPAATPSDVGSDNKQQVVHTGNPLHGVRENMLIVAGHLSKGLVNQQTRQLQTGIVASLDELIDELEQQSNSSQQQQAAQQQQQQMQQQAQSEQRSSASSQTQSSDSQSSPSSESASDAEQQPGQTQPSPDSPAQKGRAARPKVELVDPKTLQQNVWGQLPEQVRKQMQSRMVEEFLPSYRQQIEAYFQSLLESKPEGN